MKFDIQYNKIIIQNKLKQHINENIAIMAGSFRIPYKYDISLIKQLLQTNSKVIIIISGISIERINQKELSNSNIQRLANIFSKYQLTQQIQEIIDNIQDMPYIELKQRLLAIKYNEQLSNRLQKYINSIEKKIYNSVIKYNDIQLTADKIIDIFNILIQDSRIQYIIAKESSPILDTVRYVNDNCQACNIKLVTIDNINQIMTTWQSLLNLFDDTNNIQEYFPKIKYATDRKYILDNFNNGSKYYNSIEQYNGVKELLNEYR